MVREYIDLEHAEPVPTHEANSTSTKLRVVFDASAKTSNNVSLNDSLLVGPTLSKPGSNTPQVQDVSSRPIRRHWQNV